MKWQANPGDPAAPTKADLLRLIDMAAAGDADALQELFDAEQPLGYAVARTLRWGAPPTVDQIRQRIREREDR